MFTKNSSALSLRNIVLLSSSSVNLAYPAEMESRENKPERRMAREPHTKARHSLHKSFGNVSEKLNELVHSPPPDWRGVLKRPAPAADPKAYDLCLRPE